MSGYDNRDADDNEGMSIPRRYSASDLLRSQMQQVTMNHRHTLKKIWKPPLLHRDTKPDIGEVKYHDDKLDIAYQHSEHRSEIWYELFYDLIFVASCTQLSHLIEHDTTWFGLFQSGLLFVVLRSTWEGLMFYQNRFDTKDLLHYLFYLFQAICAYIIAEHFTIDEETEKWSLHRNMKAIAYAAAIARIGQSLMYTQLMYLTHKYSKHIFAVAMSQRLSAAIYLLSALLPYDKEYYYIFWLVAEVVERSAVMLYIWLFLDSSTAENVRLPLHFEHVIHREGTFVLLILGEAIILLVQRKNENSFYDIMFGILSFASVFNIGDLYYQQQVVGYRHYKATKTTAPTFMWVELHQALAISMLFFGVGVNLVYAHSRESNSLRDITNEILMCSGASVSLVIIYYLRISYRGLYATSSVGHRLLSYLFRFAISIVTAFVPYISPNSRWSIVAVFLLTLVLILQDLGTHLVGNKDEDDGRSSFTATGTHQHSADHHAAPLLGVSQVDLFDDESFLTTFPFDHTRPTK